ncbi:1-phosphatidylinositol-3-phosphate 5-kinase FAB1B [Linum perenne]
MGSPHDILPDFVRKVKSLISGRSEPADFSRDFWMPDQSCRVCYECDSQFTVFNRRHHCRICGRIFCAKCTANAVLLPPDDPSISHEDKEKVRVCNYCFKQYEQNSLAVDNGSNMANPGLNSSPSTTSLTSSTCNNSSIAVGSTPYSTGPYHCVSQSCRLSPENSAQMDTAIIKEDNEAYRESMDLYTASFQSSPTRNAYCMDSVASDDDDDDDDCYGIYRSGLQAKHFSYVDEYCGSTSVEEFDHACGINEVHHKGDLLDNQGLSCSPLTEDFNTKGVDGIKGTAETSEPYGDECDPSPYDVENPDNEPVDFENNGLLWLPPEPEDEDDERETPTFDDDDDDEDDGTTGEWGYLRPSNSFGSGELRSREKSSEEHRKAMKNVVEGHFRALVAQLLQVENLPIGEDDDKNGWLYIITTLSWEAASHLKPDTSNGGGMDPGGYVKVKCLACGRRSESMVVKGVVCKKNVAHRRMMSKINKPRFLILGGALEYQRVPNLLSSVDTLLQQEMDHLKMAVAKIEAHHPNVLLVEKSVSRCAQECLLAKDISLVLNIKKPLLDRVARCTGAQIVPSVDHFTSQKLGHCDSFHVEKFLEEHGSAGQGGKKLTKTLMFFEGCPKPFGCTILLKGASGDELKKVKHVVQYGVFAAYHLALETSFLADEGASLPELSLRSPLTVALPDKSSIDRSISAIPGFGLLGGEKPVSPQTPAELGKLDNGAGHIKQSEKGFISETSSSTIEKSTCKIVDGDLNWLSENLSSQTRSLNFGLNANEPHISSISPSFGDDLWDPHNDRPPSNHVSEGSYGVDSKDSLRGKEDDLKKVTADVFLAFSGLPQQGVVSSHANNNLLPGNSIITHVKDGVNQNEDIGSLKEDFPPSPSDQQSILVSSSTRCVWKGTVCERAHLCRIKYYGSFDRPLGRFLRDQLFDQVYNVAPAVVLVRCHQKHMFIVILIDKAALLYRLGDYLNFFYQGKEREKYGCGIGVFDVLGLMASHLLHAEWLCLMLHGACLLIVYDFTGMVILTFFILYGFGRMVACFRYASIDVNSVHLPPSKLEFNYESQDWIQTEANEVRQLAELLFTEVGIAFHKVLEKISSAGLQDDNLRTLSRLCVLELEQVLQNEKEEFEEYVQKTLMKLAKVGQPAVDILDINRLRRQIMFHSYVWDQRLIQAGSSSMLNVQEGQKNFMPELKGKHIGSVEKLSEMDSSNPGISSLDSFLVEAKSEVKVNHGSRDKEDRDTELNQSPAKKDDPSCCMIEQTDPLQQGNIIRRVRSEGEFPVADNLSDTLEAAWTGKNHQTSLSLNGCSLPTSARASTAAENAVLDHVIGHSAGVGTLHSLSSVPSANCPQKRVKPINANPMPFPNIYTSLDSSLIPQNLSFSDYNPVYIPLLKEMERQSGARLLLPVGVNDTIVPVYDDEPTSIVAHALVSSAYHAQMSELEKTNVGDSLSVLDSASSLSLSVDDTFSDTLKSLGSLDESILSLATSRGSQVSDPLSYSKDLHAKVSFNADGPLGKVKYTVICYYAKRFEALRKICCPYDLDFVRSLSRCKKWGAQGGKSNVFFAKTLDDRFIVKQVTKTELESFIKFGSEYFKYLSESISSRSPTCLAKILGIYQVSKQVKGGKETKMDILVMENLLYRRVVTRLYDLKGSSRSRYNPDTSGSNKVLLDQNLIEAMPTSPIFVGNKAKRLLERAVWNDTAFLASIDVMDYSLLVGVDEEKHELVLGIIDFMRQYTWDKHLETWVKASGILGGPKNSMPTVISPQQYKKRYRKAMTAYFVMVPDQWSPSTVVPSGSQSDAYEDNNNNNNSMMQHAAASSSID